jgi:hypothetical protein
MTGDKLAIGVVGALALAAAAASRSSQTKGSANLSAARRDAFDALAEAYRDYGLRAGRGERNATREENQRFGRSKKVKFLGAGWSRAVFRVPEGALKIEMGWAPFVENQREAKLWGSVPANLAPHLVPVLDHAHDYSWILMPEVEVGGTLDLAAARALAACGITDFQNVNTSTDGRLVDYAFIFDGDKLEGCLERGRAQRRSAPTNQGSTARVKHGSQSGSTYGKPWAELRADLEAIGHGVLGEHILASSLKTCSVTAPAVMQYLLERGHVVSPGGQDRPSGYTHHFDLAVLTSDRGWLNIDPTFMQFHCRHQPRDEEDWADLVDLKRHLQRVWADPMAAYRIDPLPWPPRPRGDTQAELSLLGGTWADYWAKNARYARSVIAKAQTGKRTPGAPYAGLIAP